MEIGNVDEFEDIGVWA